MTFYRPQNNDMTQNLTEASDQHDMIISAIERGDDLAAAQLAEDHWNLSRNQIEMFVMPEALQVQLGTFARKDTARGANDPHF